jgi:phosphatidylinositol alpha-1,6-mannosyltransferase
VLFSHLGLARAERLVPAPLRAPYAVFLHGVEAWRRLGPVDRHLLAGAALRLANSNYTADRVREANPEIGPVDVCPLALLPGSHAAPSAGGRPASRMVLTVGRMASGERYKGHDELIDAWPGVIAAQPDAELVVVGEGDDRPRLEERARGGRAGHRIRFTGFVGRAELDALFAGAAVFAMPSRGEGFGLVYLEAMAHGLPCVGSRHDAAREVIADGRTGLLVDLDRPGALAAALIRLLGDEGLRTKLGESGRERLRTQFTFDGFSRRVGSLLEAALEPAALRAPAA